MWDRFVRWTFGPKPPAHSPSSPPSPPPPMASAPPEEPAMATPSQPASTADAIRASAMEVYPEDAEAAALLQSTNLNSQLVRLSKMTKDNMPPKHPKVNTRSHYDVLSTILEPIGSRIISKTREEPNGPQLELRCCKQIARKYWPLPVGPFTHMYIFEMYRNHIYKKRMRAEIMAEQSSTTPVNAPTNPSVEALPAAAAPTTADSPAEQSSDKDMSDPAPSSHIYRATRAPAPSPTFGPSSALSSLPSNLSSSLPSLLDELAKPEPSFESPTLAPLQLQVDANDSIAQLLYQPRWAPVEDSPKRRRLSGEEADPAAVGSPADDGYAADAESDEDLERDTAMSIDVPLLTDWRAYGQDSERKGG